MKDTLDYQKVLNKTKEDRTILSDENYFNVSVIDENNISMPLEKYKELLSIGLKYNEKLRYSVMLIQLKDMMEEYRSARDSEKQ